ncbi:unnamed protein product [Alopecurus aequalis]
MDLCCKLARMALCRKYDPGKILVIGCPFRVEPLMLFRRRDIPKFIMEEVYECNKVGICDEVQKEHVDSMIEDLEPFEGQALLDAKCFK